MDLLIKDDDGTAWTVVADLESYDLDKPLSRVSLIEDIKETLSEIREDQS